MRFLSTSKTQEWIDTRFGSNHETRSTNQPGDDNSPEIQMVVTGLEPPRLISFLEDYVKALQSWNQCLVWVRDPGLGNADLNLYYQLRKSYGDHHLLEEAPGHLFVEHEIRDLRTLLLVCLVNAWDADIFPGDKYARGHISHDGWMSLRSRHEWVLQEVESIVKERQLPTRQC